MAECFCDLCGAGLERFDTLYSVRIDIRPTTGMPPQDEEFADRDHLLELHEILEHLDGEQLSDLGADDSHLLNFFLCQQCCKKLREHPLPRETATPQLDFSEN